MEVLFQNKTTDGDSVVFSPINSGYYILKSEGTFDGADITILLDFNDSVYEPLVLNNIPQLISAVGINTVVFLKVGTRLKANLANASGSTDVTLKIL